MNNLALSIILLLLALGGVVIRKTYYYFPARELKRRAAKHDPLASNLYRAVAYGNSLRALLWLYIGLSAAAGLVLMARSLQVWASLLIAGPLLWTMFSLVPATRLTGFGVWLTKLVTPLIAWLLNYLHPLLSRCSDFAARRHLVTDEHTRLFDREDLLDLVRRQQIQTDNRLTEEELQIVKHALSFNDHKVVDVLTPRKAIKTVLAGDIIGPILIDEVHKSGQQQVLVRDKRGGKIVGTLAVSRLGLESSGNVRDVMNQTVHYLHENDSLGEALHAFFATNQSVFVVVNSFEEFVGIVSVQSMINELLGHVPGDDFDQYTDPAVVAARHVHKKTSP